MTSNTKAEQAITILQQQKLGVNVIAMDKLIQPLKGDILHIWSLSDKRCMGLKRVLSSEGSQIIWSMQKVLPLLDSTVGGSHPHAGLLSFPSLPSLPPPSPQQLCKSKSQL